MAETEKKSKNKKDKHLPSFESTLIPVITNSIKNEAIECLNDYQELSYMTPLKEVIQQVNETNKSLTMDLIPSNSHQILFNINDHSKAFPKELITDTKGEEHVLMPYSTEATIKFNGEKWKRWDLIKYQLQEIGEIKNSFDLEERIFSYNNSYKQSEAKFDLLHHLFNENLENDYADNFFANVLPFMIDLAVKLPELIPEPLCLLSTSKPNCTVTLRRDQIACLLCNAFFCTFLRHNTDSFPLSPNSLKKKQGQFAYPAINFASLFASPKSLRERQKIDNGCGRKVEKLKCLLAYFCSIRKKLPNGIISFTRRNVTWESSQWNEKADGTHLEVEGCHVSINCQGGIEDGVGCLQVDFANKLLGGGVLRTGCVQEEIRFATAPELLISCLLTQRLEARDALIVSGDFETFAQYQGYASTFFYKGPSNNQLLQEGPPGKSYLVAIDAKSFGGSHWKQFQSHYIIRELTKAYCGFSQANTPKWISTGNWGCGAFRGNIQLKAVIQLMAATRAGKNLCYFTFGNSALAQGFSRVYRALCEHKVSVAQLFGVVCAYRTDRHTAEETLFEYLLTLFPLASS